MVPVTTLLISRDAALASSVKAVVGTIENLTLSTVDEVSAAYDYGDWGSVALVVIHCERPSHHGEVVRLLRMIQATRRPVATLVIAEYDDPNHSVTLLQLGVADYLTTPLDLDHLAYMIDSLSIRSRYARNGVAEVKKTVAATPVETEPQAPADFLLDLGLPTLSDQVRRVAPQDATVLLTGETGTGKTRLAKAIHDLSRRRDEPFLVVNCGSLSSSLVESEMFGHVRGASDDRLGKFAEVGRGTLFIDEIDTLSPALQVKLLRVVENREFEIAGTNETRPVLARIIAASNRPLEAEVAAGRFRSDLYFRLNVVNFNLPPLRDHRGAVAGLAAIFAKASCTKLGKPAATIQPEALRALEAYPWPGNIRELRNLIERAVLLGAGTEIRLEDLPDAIRSRQSWPTPAATNGVDHLDHGSIPVPASADSDHYSRSTLAQIKRDAELARISEALKKHSNNRLRAASELGISRMTLYKKLYKYGLMTAGGRSENHEPAHHAS